MPFICLSWLDVALESVPHPPNGVPVNCLPSFWLSPFLFLISIRKEMSAGEALMSVQASRPRLLVFFDTEEEICDFPRRMETFTYSLSICI